MDGVSVSTLLPVLTLVLGLVLKAGLDAITERRRAEVERDIRLERRKETLLLRRIDQQRKCLEELQEIHADLIRSAAQLNQADEEAARKGLRWGASGDPDGISEVFRVCQRKALILRERVESDIIRKKSSEFSAAVSDVALATSSEQAEGLMISAGLAFSVVNASVGEAIRALESDSQALIR
ncbi:hypothetical protein [Pseudomonas tohonis]|uniref:Chemotaxis protein n=1 Tax=Pseudomonas tohonis TaxID=2725477 RepID=A0ABQ4VTF7_9PSED|nr:hypothetical protein [Pseudomonas tohonis]GJN50830.1 hypothetical protein TUM20286_05820 [Pseudomonas tohonis]